MANEMKMDELNQVAGGAAVNGKYYNYVSNGWTPYQIKAGDTLSGLAASHGTTMAAVMSINPLLDNANVICVGYWLLLPGSGSGSGSSSGGSGSGSVHTGHGTINIVTK